MRPPNCSSALSHRQSGSGLCLFAKRLEKGKFVWPPIVEGALQLTAAQLALLLEGIDWRRTVAPPQTDRPRIA